MPMRPCSAVSLLLLVFVFAPAQAWAKPRHATFKEVVETSATIAVAKFAEKNPDFTKRNQDLEILQILKGDLKPGKHRVPCEDQPWFAHKGEAFIVFLDKAKVWRFVADPLNGKKLEDDLLVMEGFYDSNAYIVSPALVTLGQLQKYLKDKTLTYRFRGAVYFPVAKEVAWKPGSLMIKGTYDAVTDVAQVEGLPDLKGIVPQPEVFMSKLRVDEGASLHLQYSLYTSRALTLMGKVDGIDLKTGEILVRFAVQAPEVLTQKAFEEYLANPKSSGPYYKFKLACKRTTDEAFPEVLYLSELKSSKKRFQDTMLEGYGKAKLETRMSAGYDSKVLYISMKTEEDTKLTLEFDIIAREKNDEIFHWAFQSLLPYSIYRTTIATGSIKIDGKTVATFTATLDSMGMNEGR